MFNSDRDNSGNLLANARVLVRSLILLNPCTLFERTSTVAISPIHEPNLDDGVVHHPSDFCAGGLGGVNFAPGGFGGVNGLAPVAPGGLGGVRVFAPAAPGALGGVSLAPPGLGGRGAPGLGAGAPAAA